MPAFPTFGPSRYLDEASPEAPRAGRAAVDRSTHEIPSAARWPFAASPFRRTAPGETPMKRLKVRLKAASDW